MQPLPAGWYWDPGGMPGLFRFWDAEGWTEHVSVRWDVAAPYAPRLPEIGDDGRFHAGRVSLPQLPEPWRRAPNYPLIENGRGQEIWVGYCHRGEFLGVAYVGELPGDGNLEVDAAAWADDLLTTFYPFGRPLPYTDAATTIAGTHAWRRDVQLPVNDPMLTDITFEHALFVVLETNPRSVVFASLPDSDRIDLTTDDLVEMLEVS